MGSIVRIDRVAKATGQPIAVFRAHVRREGFASKSKVFTAVLGAKSQVADDKAVAKALRAAEEWLRENDATATLSLRTSGKTLSSLIEDFVLAPPMQGTKFWSAMHMDFWKHELGSMRVADVSRGDVNSARAKLQSRGAFRSTPLGPKATAEKLTPATINRYLAALSSVFNYALAHEIIDAHPMKGGKVSKLKESGGRTRVLSAAEETRLLDAASASTWPMLRLCVRLALTSAARKGEILNLKWKDVRLAESVAVLGKTKNGHPRALPLVSDVKAALLEAEKVKPLRSDFVFFDPRDPSRPKNIATVWRACRQAAGLWNDREDPLDRVVLHTTRHTSVTKMIKGGANLAQAAAVSGHKTLAMLKRYEHLAAADSVELAERLLSGNSQ